MKGTVYVVGNFKGGVGKTKLTTMLSYQSAVRKGRKTLVIDMDPQGNATRVLAKTGDITTIDHTINEAFEVGQLEPYIIPVLDNLDMIGANTTFRNLPRQLADLFPDDEDAQIFYLRDLLVPLKKKYDAIYIDVPPTISDYSDNAMLAADYCIIVLQTQELSLDGVKTYVGYMQYLADRYHSGLNVLGIVPMLLRPGGRVDNKVLKEAQELYGGNVLDNIIRYQERLKAYDVEGIAHYPHDISTDNWDKRAHQIFLDILEELDQHEKILEEYLQQAHYEQMELEQQPQEERRD